MNLVESLLVLLLGWLLGLLGPAIVDSIRRSRDNKLGREALVGELYELAPVLATAAFGARVRTGGVDRKFLLWTKAALERFPSLPNHAQMVENIDKMLAEPDSRLNAANTQLAIDDGKGTVLQHYPVPLLDARISALWSFDTVFQRKLLVLRRHLALLDDLVDRSHRYLEMTFSQSDNANHPRIVENLNQTYPLYADRAVLVVDLIWEIKVACR